MTKKCTSPCFPKCKADATLTLKSTNGSFLGENCAIHIPKKNADKDYIIEPIKDKHAE